MLIIEKMCKLIIIILFIIPISLYAQADANGLFEAGEWVAAADAYELRTDANPHDGVA